MRRKSDKHLKEIRHKPCVLCGDDTSVEAAHIRFVEPLAAKASGTGIKPDDNFVVPLCGKHHREQHSMNERSFWEMHGWTTNLPKNPLVIALLLYVYGDDLEKCDRIIQAHGAEGEVW